MELHEILNKTTQLILVVQGKPNAGKSFLSIELLKIFDTHERHTLYLSSDLLRIPQHLGRLPGDIISPEEFKQAGENFDSVDGGIIVNDNRELICPTNKWKFSMWRALIYMKKQIADNPNSIIIIDGQFNTNNDDCVDFLLYLNQLNQTTVSSVHFFFLDITLSQQEKRHLLTNKTYDVSELKKYIVMPIKDSLDKILVPDVKNELLKISQDIIDASKDITDIINYIFHIINYK
jgi:hypothetical protein